jgi:hypothetical protein
MRESTGRIALIRASSESVIFRRLVLCSSSLGIFGTTGRRGFVEREVLRLGVEYEWVGCIEERIGSLGSCESTGSSSRFAIFCQIRVGRDLSCLTFTVWNLQLVIQWTE